MTSRTSFLTFYRARSEGLSGDPSDSYNLLGVTSHITPVDEAEVFIVIRGNVTSAFGSPRTGTNFLPKAWDDTSRGLPRWQCWREEHFRMAFSAPEGPVVAFAGRADDRTEHIAARARLRRRRCGSSIQRPCAFAGAAAKGPATSAYAGGMRRPAGWNAPNYRQRLSRCTWLWGGTREKPSRWRALRM